MLKLRPYQNEAIQSIFQKYREGEKRILLVMATGCGKTVVFSSIADMVVRRGVRVLILAHRDELLTQAASKLANMFGVESTIEKGKDHAILSNAPVVIASVQTLSGQKRLAEWRYDSFGLIIVDEAHHSVANTYKRILDYFSKAKVLGVTATPNRADKKDLSKIYSCIAYEYGLKVAIDDGYLSNIQVRTIPLKIDISNVSVSVGDFEAQELADTLEPYLAPIADCMVQECRKRKTIVFLPLVKISQLFQQLLQERGFRVAEINGCTKDRKEILRDFHEGKYDVLVNAMLLTEGFDEPSVDCVVVLRPTKSFSLYTQMVGRGTRKAKGKRELLLLDFLWLTGQYDLCRPASLIAPSTEIAQKMTEAMESMGTADLSTTLQEAILDASAQASGNGLNPLVVDIAKELAMEDVLNYTPTFKWEKNPATIKQLKTLEKFGLPRTAISDRGLACRLITHLVERIKQGLATLRQIRLLHKFGYKEVARWTFAKADKTISWLAKNSWRVPKKIAN